MAVLAGEIHSLSRVVALVTGGASGLGRATAARLVNQVLQSARAGNHMQETSYIRV